MLNDIGLIVGIYAFIRLAAIIDRKDSGIILRVFAAIGMLLVAVFTFDILIGAFKNTPGIPSVPAIR